MKNAVIILTADAHHIRGREALALLAVIPWLGVLLQLYLSIKLALGNGKFLLIARFCVMW